MQETKDLSFHREKYEDYVINLRWDKKLLFDLVDKRIKSLFQRQYSPNKPVGFYDIFNYKVGNKDPFDYIIERTLMRPRDIIAFVNQCIKVCEGVFEISVAHIKHAEKEYSRIRREALEQEWQSAFPSLKMLLDFIASPKKESFPLTSLLEGDAAERLALEIAMAPKVDFDPAGRFYQWGVDTALSSA